MVVTATFALEDTGYEVYLPERLIAKSTLAFVRLSLEYSLLLADRSSRGGLSARSGYQPNLLGTACPNRAALMSLVAKCEEEDR